MVKSLKVSTGSVRGWARLVVISVLAASLAVVLPGGSERSGSASAQSVPTRNGDGSFSVAADWALVPSGLSEGDRFRLLFLTHSKRNARSGNIAHYNTFVQADAKDSTGEDAAHSAIRPYGDFFTVVGSTGSVDARANTGMWDSTDSAWADGSTSSNKASGTSIWWLGGSKMASSYADFCDGSIASIAARNAAGLRAAASELYVATGSGNDCAKRTGATLGAARPTAWHHIGDSLTRVLSEKYTPSHLLGISPEFVAGRIQRETGPCRVGFDHAHPDWKPEWTVREGAYVEVPVSLSGDCSGLGPATYYVDGTSITEQAHAVPVSIDLADGTHPQRPGDEMIGWAEDPTTGDNVVVIRLLDDDLVEPDWTFEAKLLLGHDHNRHGDLSVPGWKRTGAQSGVQVDTDRDDITLRLEDDERNWVWWVTQKGIQLQRDMYINRTWGFIVYDNIRVARFSILSDTASAFHPFESNIQLSRIDGIALAIGERYEGRFGSARDCVVAIPEHARLPRDSQAIINAVATTNRLCTRAAKGDLRYVSAGFPAAQNNTPTPTPLPPAVLPEISIIADSTSVTEGGSADFTVTASPAPAADLAVRLDVAETHGSDPDVISLNALTTLTIGAGQTTAVYTHTTHDDKVDLGGGTLSAAVAAGDGYTVSATAGTATTTITDDDTESAVFVPDAVLVEAVTAKADAHSNAAAAQRLRKIVKGMTGESGGYTAAECRDTAKDYGVLNRWGPWCDEIERREGWVAPASGNKVLPTVGVQPSSGVVEGDDYVFTVTASPAPDADLTVTLDVAVTGDFGVAAGTYTVTIGAGKTKAALTLSTTDDSTDEASGAIEVTVSPADDYNAGSGNAVAAIADNDDPPTVTPTVSIAAGSGVTEGTAATFTLTASPAPASSLSVNVTVSHSGDYGVTARTQTVTIGTSGTATLTVATSGDDVDEPDGTVTATISAGSGYNISTSAGSAAVAVTDDDDPPDPDPAPPGEAVSSDAEALELATSERARLAPLRNISFDYWMVHWRLDIIAVALEGGANGANNTQNGWYLFRNTLINAVNSGDAQAVDALTRLGDYFVNRYNLIIDYHDLGYDTAWPTL